MDTLSVANHPPSKLENMKDKEKKIEEFLKELKRQSPQDFGWKIEGDVGDILKHFAISCKKCGSPRIFISWEEGVNYGGYTGYSSGQKLFKCLDCGNAASFWE